MGAETGRCNIVVVGHGTASTAVARLLQSTGYDTEVVGVDQVFSASALTDTCAAPYSQTLAELRGYTPLHRKPRRTRRGKR